MTGRPHGVTPEVAAKLEVLLGDGKSRESAAILAGVAPRTAQRWLQQATDGVEPYCELLMPALQAEARFLDELEQEIRSGRNIKGDDDWQARKALLASRRPGTWGQRIRIETMAQDWIRELVTEMDRDLEAGRLSAEVYLGFVEWLRDRAGSAPSLPPTPELLAEVTEAE